MRNKKEMVTTGDGWDVEEWRGKVTSSQDPGFPTGGAGLRAHGDIQEALEGWGRKHCRCKHTWRTLGPILLRLVVAMEAIGGLWSGEQWGLGDLVRNRWGTHREARRPSRTDRARRSWDTLGRRGAWFNWVLLPPPPSSPS